MRTARTFTPPGRDAARRDMDPQAVVIGRPVRATPRSAVVLAVLRAQAAVGTARMFTPPGPVGATRDVAPKSVAIGLLARVAEVDTVPAVRATPQSAAALAVHRAQEAVGPARVARGVVRKFTPVVAVVHRRPARSGGP